MKIGNLVIDNPLVLAPMAGVTQMPYRQLCREQGAGLTYTEMVSAKALHYRNKNTLPLLAKAPNEDCLALQLFGSEPELLAEEAEKLEETGRFAVFDVNMGCPVPKVVNNGEGSALMKDPKKIEAIVSAMTRRLHTPVTIKIRRGFDESSLNAAEIARIAEGSGAAAIAVHGRTREEYYGGQAHWDAIREVREAVSIPVMGSGDIFTPEDAARMLSETGCDAVLIARGARGNPWIFSRTQALLKGDPVPPKPSIPEVKEMIRRHLQLMIDFTGETAAIRQMRMHVGFYCQGYPNATWLRREINQAENSAEFLKILTTWGH